MWDLRIFPLEKGGLDLGLWVVITHDDGMGGEKGRKLSEKWAFGRTGDFLICGGGMLDEDYEGGILSWNSERSI